MSDERDPEQDAGPRPHEPQADGTDPDGAGTAGAPAGDARSAPAESYSDSAKGTTSPYGPAGGDVVADVTPSAPAAVPAAGAPGTAAPGTAAGDPPPPHPPAGYSATGPSGEDATGAAGYAPPAGAASQAGDPSYAGAPPYASQPAGNPSYAGAPPYAGPPAGDPSYAAAPPSAAAPPYVTGAPPRPRGGKGLAIAALVVGIAAFLGAFIPVLNYAVFVPAVVAVVLGIVSLVRRMDGKPLAVSGIVLGGVGFVLSIVLAIVYTFAFVSSVTEAVESAGADSGFASPEPIPGEDEDAGTGEDAALPGTSPDDPLPIGTPVTGEGLDGPEWQVVLGTPVLDATAEVLAADPTNEAPAEGMQYAVVPVTATYLGATVGDPLSELAVGFLAADGSQYSAADSFVLAPAPAFTDNGELLDPLGTATGNVVVEIPIDGAADGLWATAPGTLSDAYYFRVG